MWLTTNILQYVNWPSVLYSVGDKVTKLFFAYVRRSSLSSSGRMLLILFFSVIGIHDKRVNCKQSALLWSFKTKKHAYKADAYKVCIENRR